MGSTGQMIPSSWKTGKQKNQFSIQYCSKVCVCACRVAEEHGLRSIKLILSGRTLSAGQ